MNHWSRLADFGGISAASNPRCQRLLRHDGRRIVASFRQDAWSWGWAHAFAAQSLRVRGLRSVSPFRTSIVELAVEEVAHLRRERMIVSLSTKEMMQAKRYRGGDKHTITLVLEVMCEAIACQSLPK